MAEGKDGPLHTRLRQKLNDNVLTYWPGRSIFKVPNHLRRISRQAYEPQVISIGPYHHGKRQLKKMEAYKMVYLNKLLQRRSEVSLEGYVTALKLKEKEARKFYSEPLNHIKGENFVEIMLFDGCFIIKLIRMIAKGKWGDDDHCFPDFILRGIARDLLLVENQLPFFILLHLFSMTWPNDGEAAFIVMAINFFSQIMPGFLTSPGNEDLKHLKIQHLLGLLHDSRCHAPSSDRQEVRVSCSPEEVIRSPCSKAKLKVMGIPCLSSPSKSAEEDDESKSTNKDRETKMEPSASVSLCNFDIRSQCPMAKLNCCSLEVLRSLASRSKEEPDKKVRRFIPSATELREAGINFKNTKGRLFDIKFQNGVLSIPTLTIEDDTELLLRNLVAYEQYFSDASRKCFTDYIAFMDCLINTGKDVELLCHHGVIDNWLGDHKVVAGMFNKLFDYVMISEDFSYADIVQEVNEHCDRRWNHWKAKLWHNYFNTPWGGISIFAAAFLLLLTLLQSVYSVLSYLFK